MQKLEARHENMTIFQGMTDIGMQLKYLAILEPRNRDSIRVIETKHMPEICSIGCFAELRGLELDRLWIHSDL